MGLVGSRYRPTPSELVTLMGRLKYRTSYGQNVLTHLVETAHIASMLAAELELDPARTSDRRYFTTSVRLSPTRWKVPML